jgi:hypothetical protein
MGPADRALRTGFPKPWSTSSPWPFTTIVVMDADLGHPRDVAAHGRGCRRTTSSSDRDRRQRKVDRVVVCGGSARWCAFMARPFTRVKDPMSLLRVPPYAGSTAKLDPVGYKIGLELIVQAASATSSKLPSAADRGMAKANCRSGSIRGPGT